MGAVDQERPRDCYVYGHADPSGTFFYIGKGSGRRAWSLDRDRMWHYYVTEHLQGRYGVVILADGMTSEAAEALESDWIAKENEGLINRQNMARSIDLNALNRRDELMKRCKSLVESAKRGESEDVALAIEQYKEAYTLLKIYSRIQFESGLYGKLIAEINDPIGQITLLDRLTLCLTKQSHKEEARQMVSEYFSIFKSERSLAAAERIMKRVNR